ncbi:protein-transporting protein BCP1 [Sporobolomyces salmoneus]|uniref:protein-transporting protein BCP1 n=1 Tax=Sporobolomyces salmoneus TaxID=183962 RepID=UPI00317324A6
MQVDQPSTKASGSSSKKRSGGASKRSAESDSEDERMDQGDDVEMLDVSFSFFDPQPQDYHSIKLLLSQLFQGDASVLDLGGVTDLVLEQKLVGSTVKTDSGEGENDEQASQGDPYAVLTVLNLNVHKDKPCISQLTNYLLSKIPSTSPFHSTLSKLLSNPASSPSDSTASKPQHIGLVLNERLVNMPVQVVPPMFKMLQEELQWAIEDKEPYHFSHYLFLSRVFNSSTSSFDEDPNAAVQQAQPTTTKATGGGKKKKKNQHVSNAEEEKTWVYHAEDEWIQRFATESQVFEYTNTKRSADASAEDQFGVDMRGQMMLVPAKKFDEVVGGMEGFIGVTV